MKSNYTKACEMVPEGEYGAITLTVDYFHKILLTAAGPEVSEEQQPEVICCGTCQHMNDGECICADECTDFKHYSIHHPQISEEIKEQIKNDVVSVQDDRDARLAELYYERGFKAALKELNK